MKHDKGRAIVLGGGVGGVESWDMKESFIIRLKRHYFSLHGRNFGFNSFTCSLRTCMLHYSVGLYLYLFLKIYKKKIILPLPHLTPIRKFPMRHIFQYWFMKSFFIHLFQSNQRKCHFLAIFELGRQFSVSAEEQKQWKIKNWFCHNVTLLPRTLSRCC